MRAWAIVLGLVAAGAPACAHTPRVVAPLVYDPQEPQAGVPRTAWSDVPGIGGPSAPACAAWKELKAPEGTHAFFAERHGFPSVAAGVFFALDSADLGDGGSERLSFLEATLLSPARYSDEEGVQTHCSRGGCWIAAQGGSADLASVLRRLATLVVHPSGWNENDTKRLTSALRRSAASWHDSSAVVDRNARALVFGRAGYGVPEAPAGDPSISTLLETRDFVTLPTGTTFVVAGDASAGDVEAQLAHAFDGWSARAFVRPAPASAELTRLSPRVVQVRGRVGSQTEATLVSRGPAPGAPDALALRLAMQILASPLTSPVYAHVREDLAAAYAVGATIQWYRHASLVTLGARIEPNKVIASTKAMISAVRVLRDDGPSPTQLAEGKATLAGQLRDTGATNAGIVYLQGAWPGGSPLDPCATRSAVDSLGGDDVRAVMRSYFAEGRYGVVLVAQDLQLEAWPDSLGLGSVEVRDGYAHTVQ